MATIDPTPKAAAAMFLRMEAELNKPIASSGGAAAHSVFGKAMERACQVVEKEAKNSLGTYHRQAGPFPAWAKLADSTVKSREAQGWEPNEPLLRLGTMRDSIQHVVVGHGGYVGSNEPIAVYQELGTARIPPRPFIGRAAFLKEFAIHRIFLNATMKLLGGGSVADAERAMGVPLGRFTTTTAQGGGE